uniref:Gamma carbonic anhydrase n=1 Tax=Chlamydomonas leiostraca TaxID=1034604 RepID=A0A7S0RQY0_9CHLO
MNPVSVAKSALWRIGFAMRESGQALERVGCRLQGIFSHEEFLSRHMPVVPVQYDAPSIASETFVAPSSLVVGNVKIGQQSSIWYNAIIRGEHQPVTIGHNTNIQDSAVVGASSEYSPPTDIGNNVSIGHGAVVKGATIGDHALVGINAVISEGAKVGGLSIIAAGSYVEENTQVPSGEVWAGNPAKKLRELKPAERDYLRSLPGSYTALGGQHQEVMDLLRMKQEEFSS